MTARLRSPAFENQLDIRTGLWYNEKESTIAVRKKECKERTSRMKHVFIANPAAGKKNSVEEIRRETAKLSHLYDITVYETAGHGDAT